MDQNQQLTQYDRVSSAFFLSIDFFSIIIILTDDFFVIWSDQMKLRQHFFLSINSLFIIVISTAGPSLIWFDQTEICQHFFLSPILYKSTFQQLIFSKEPRQHLFLSSVHTGQIWTFSAEITPRRQRYMEILDDFHIEEYFHLFFFMNWILNFISVFFF